MAACSAFEGVESLKDAELKIITLVIDDYGHEHGRATILGCTYKASRVRFGPNVSKQRDGPVPAPACVVLWMNVTRKRRDLNAGPFGVRELMSPLLN
ncbi:hypothetical protein HPB50_006520 [Hyalomma asiaticum]|uniref:Uncharacterized protein n=1 Tax=Hyalomma asiaticum TaxID=266040 RepID=A0ACB7RRG1_HYAAI|nr:hypothetical protein HPB50_006520 [Hyalomma asiaticum]